MLEGIATAITEKSIVVNFDGQTHIVRADNRYHQALLQAIKDGNVNEVKQLACISNEIVSKTPFELRNGVVYLDDKPVPSKLGNKILSFYENKIPFEPLIEFTRKVRNNPSFRVVNQLFDFLEANEHPITPNGCFIAYKKVANPDEQGRMMDLKTKTIDNKVGTWIEMPRNMVNDNPSETCSHGLHAANWDYATNHYGSPNDTMLQVCIDPSDVVSIPYDYNQSKLRVCRYYVDCVVKNPNANKFVVEDCGVAEEELEEDSDDLPNMNVEQENETTTEEEPCSNPNCLKTDYCPDCYKPQE